MKTLKNTVLLIAAVFLYLNTFAQSTLIATDSFGTNPGNLKMYSYVPAGISDTVSLVVALHGCTQTAATFALQTGWNKLADRHKFIVLYPEQQSANNSSFCFNWFDSTYQVKNQIEVLSVKQMVDYMKAHYKFDTTKIYMTGLSAGACMTTVMLANYPELFRKGAIMAGVPYKASKDTSSAFSAMGGSVIRTPGEWSKLVKDQNPLFTGSYPHVAIFQGTTDYVVSEKNAGELIKQWTDLDNADQIPDNIDTLFQGDTAISQIIYRDSIDNTPVVCYYKIKGMGHGIAVDTGACPRQGGEVAAYALSTRSFHSTYWAADFFGLIQQPYSISGPAQVSQNATNVMYYVNSDSGSIYTWTVPDSALIVSGQGTDTIIVDFGANSGVVTVQEMSTDSCINDLASIKVSVLNYGVSISQTASISCNGAATAALSANVTGGKPPYTYVWLPIGGTASIANGLMAGNYTVTVTDSLMAVISSQTFIVVESPVISTSQTLTICSGSSLIIGTQKHSTSGTFTDTLTSYKGCDSIVISNLTISPPKTVIQSITKCPGGTVTVGTTTYSLTGTFTDTLTGFGGCDSVIITDLTILPVSTFSQTLTLCPGQSVNVGASHYTAGGTYSDILSSFNGCDSTVVTHLIILPENIQTQWFSICSGQHVRVGSSDYNTDATYTDLFTSFKGCDSTVITHVTVANKISVDQTLTICSGQNSIVGNSYYDQTGIYIDTLQAFYGCDSIVTTNLTVTEPIDVAVTIADGVNGVELTASNNAAIYQWIKCISGNDTIPLATAQSYTPFSKGSYAVIITEDLCSDTSLCYDITTTVYTGIAENIDYSAVNIYPNPFSTNTTIEFDDEQVNTLIKITDILGTEIRSFKFSGNQMILEKGEMQAGTYFIQILDVNKNILNRKIVIQ